MNANYDKNEKIRADIFLKIKYDIRDARIGYSGHGEIYAGLYFFERINISDGVAGMQIFFWSRQALMRTCAVPTIRYL